MRNVKNLSLCVILLLLPAAATSIANEYEIVDLGTMGGHHSFAYGINDSGQVVGHLKTSGGAEHAFVWDSSSGMEYLNDLLLDGSGWVLESAHDISDTGQIVGRGTINGQTRAYLLTPTEPIPEPSTILLLTTGLGGVVTYGFRRRKKA